MVLEPKGEPDGIENSISAIKGVSYSCNENRSKEYVHIEIDMPPANGHLVSICKIEFVMSIITIIVFRRLAYVDQ